MTRSADIRTDEESGARRFIVLPLRRWLGRVLSDPQRVILLALTGGLVAFLWIAGDVLAPILASIVIAYLVDRPVEALVRLGVSRTLCAILLTVAFVAALAVVMLLLVPLLLSQIAAFARSLPGIFSQLQALLLSLARDYPEFIDETQIVELSANLNRDVVGLGQSMVLYSVAQLPTLATVLIYVFILPLLVFFFIKDQPQVLAWAEQFLPEDRPLADRVWREISFKIGGYIRGKIYEIVIVAAVTYAAFSALDLDFAALLAALSGASVLIPYFGAPMAGVPVALVGFSQFGPSAELVWVMAVYVLIQILDGAILGTLLLAGAVNLHPIAVMVAIFVFGDIYGFWGLFFAVPLASAVQVVLSAWTYGAASAAAPSRDPYASAESVREPSRR